LTVESVILSQFHIINYFGDVDGWITVNVQRCADQLVAFGKLSPSAKGFHSAEVDLNSEQL